MRTKISPETTDIPVDSDADESTALAKQSTEVGDYAGYDPGYYDDVSRDTDVPPLMLVGNTGGLAKLFKNQAGNFVFNDQLVGPTVDVIPVAVLKYYVERARNGAEIKYGTPDWNTRKRFATATEARQAGYVIDFKNKAPFRIEEAGRIGFLVVAPAGANPEDFPLYREHDLGFALGKSSYQRGGYREVFQTVFNHAVKLTQLKKIATKGMSHTELFRVAQPWAGIWTLRAQECYKGENLYYEPRISKKAALPADAVAWITENYGDVRVDA
jgi:hypothetical protein